jgi:hypothetical protein
LLIALEDFARRGVVGDQQFFEPETRVFELGNRNGSDSLRLENIHPPNSIEKIVAKSGVKPRRKLRLIQSS